MGYCIRPGFLAPGLPAKTQEQEDEIARPALEGVLGPKEEEDDAEPHGPENQPAGDGHGVLRTFRTFSRVEDIERENAQWVNPPRRILPRQPASNSTPRYWTDGSPSPTTRARTSPRGRDPWMNPYNLYMPELTPPSIPRPESVDDDKPVPPPEQDGLTHLWSMANALARNMEGHLTRLKKEYAKTSPIIKGSKTYMIDQLIQRFEVDKRALKSLQKVCCRHRSILSLDILPATRPYKEKVLVLRQRLNAWLEAWETHGEDLQEHDHDDSTLVSVTGHHGHGNDDRHSSGQSNNGSHSSDEDGCHCNGGGNNGSRSNSTAHINTNSPGRANEGSRNTNSFGSGNDGSRNNGNDNGCSHSSSNGNGIGHGNGNGNDHGTANSNGIGNGNGNGHKSDSDKNREDNISHDEAAPMDLIRQHLQDWLAKIDALPPYPTPAEVYIEPGKPMFWDSVRSERMWLERIVREEDEASRRQPDTSSDLLDQFRTAARRQADESARQGYAPGSPEL